MCDDREQGIVKVPLIAFEAADRVKWPAVSDHDDVGRRRAWAHPSGYPGGFPGPDGRIEVHADIKLGPEKK